MSVQRLQTCENCGASRELEKDASEQLGGWRDLTARGRTATFCTDCIIELVTMALDAAEARKTSEAEHR